MKGSTLYLLDTNTVGYIVSGRSKMARDMLNEVLEQFPVAISVITEAEIHYGLARRPEAVRLRHAVEAFLSSTTILSWDSKAARAYATLRAQLSATGKALSNIDMLIAAQAIATDAILVTSDKAFLQVEALRPVVNWASDL